MEEMKTCHRTHDSQMAGKSGRKHSKDRLRACLPPLLSRQKLSCCFPASKSEAPVPPANLHLCAASQAVAHDGWTRSGPVLRLTSALLFQTRGSLWHLLPIRRAISKLVPFSDQPSLEATQLEDRFTQSSLGTPLFRNPKTYSTLVLLTTAQNNDLTFSSRYAGRASVSTLL